VTSEEGVRRLEPALRRDAAGAFHFACVKALVSIKLRGHHGCRRFCAKDHVVFVADGNALTIQYKETGVMRCRFPWDQIETLAAGEPETDSGSLFQG
jgi:hypothetical protein